MVSQRIAVISDLHVGPNARGVDMCPHKLEEAKQLSRERDYVSHLIHLVKSKEFEEIGPISALCIPGDMSAEAHAEEFRLADQAIRRISGALGINDNSIYYVPGNHDAHWRVMSLEPRDFWQRFKYAPLLQDGLLFLNQTKQANFGSIQSSPFTIVWCSDSMLLVGINSAGHDFPDATPHHGLIRQESLRDLEVYLDSLELKEEQLRICMLHHHPVQYSDPIPNESDFSIVGNAENFLNTMKKYRFDLILHGHKHYPRVESRLDNNGHPYVTMCAGTFSSILDPLWHSGVSNFFHIIEVTGRDSVTGGIKGFVRTWRFCPTKKWTPSAQQAGMLHIESFGSSATELEVRNMLNAALGSILSVKSYCKWSDLVEECPDIAHVRHSVSYRSLKYVCGQMGHEVAGDPNSEREHWTILAGSKI